MHTYIISFSQAIFGKLCINLEKRTSIHPLIYNKNHLPVGKHKTHFPFCPTCGAGMSVPRRFWSFPRHVGRRRTLGDLFSTGFGQGGAHAFLSPSLSNVCLLAYINNYVHVCLCLHVHVAACFLLINVTSSLLIMSFFCECKKNKHWLHLVLVLVKSLLSPIL